MFLLTSDGSSYLFGEKPSPLPTHREDGEVGSLPVVTRGQSWLMAPEHPQLVDLPRGSGIWPCPWHWWQPEL